jgi:hypothetical protein
MTIEEIKTAKVERVFCQQSMLNFSRYFFKSRFNRKMIVAPHIEKICEVLDKVVNGEITHLIINIAPRYGKTEVAVKNFIAYGLAINPASKFIHLSYADDLALDNSEEARDIVTSEDYKKLFPEVTIKRTSDSKKKWYTEQTGGVYATAAGGQVTGFGAGRVDPEEDEMDLNDGSNGFAGALIIDDPIKPEDADSDRVRERVNQRYDSTIKNRVNSRNTPIIITAQRTHERDLCGYVIEKEGRLEDGGKWHVLSLPSIQEDGTALWPFKHTLEELEELRRINEIVFERQHLQNPQPLAGKLFPRKYLQFYDPDSFDPKDAEYIMCVVDPANRGGDSYSAPFGFVMGQEVYIHDVVFNTKGTGETVPATLDKATYYGAHEMIVEGNFNWAQLGAQMREEMATKAPECSVRVIQNKGAKETRIIAQQSFIKLRFRFRSDYENLREYRKFMEGLFSYNVEGENDHDDAPDSCALMAFMLQRNLRYLFTEVQQDRSE